MGPGVSLLHRRGRHRAKETAKEGGEKERERGRSNIDSFMLFCAGVVLETRVPFSAVLVGGPKRGPCFRELPIF